MKAGHKSFLRTPLPRWGGQSYNPTAKNNPTEDGSVKSKAAAELSNASFSGPFPYILNVIYALYAMWTCISVCVCA